MRDGRVRRAYLGLAMTPGPVPAAWRERLGRKTGLLVAEVVARHPADAPAELAAIGRGYVRFAVTHPAHFEVMFRLDALDPANAEFTAASEAAHGLLIATIERCGAAGRLHGRSPELVAVSAWSMVHGLSALWISGRLSERITEQDPQRLAAAVSDLFVEAVLPEKA